MGVGFDKRRIIIDNRCDWSDVPNPLAYSPRSLSDHRMRNARRVSYTVVAGVAFICALLCVRQMPSRLAAMNAQRPVMNFQFAPNQVAYSDTRQLAVTHREEPAEWNAFKPFVGNAGKRTTLFLHQMISPAGHKRIVRLSCEDRQGDGAYLQGIYEVIEPGSISRGPVELWFSQASRHIFLPSSLTVYGGQRDPGDPSHFTIGLQYGGKNEIIDGWLMDDDSVKLEPRL
jgi:hypothetical protein